MLRIIAVIALFTLFLACKSKSPTADAYGNFEADDLIVSAEANGLLLDFSVEEGQTLSAGTQVGRVDSTQLVLKKEQLQAAIRAVSAKSPAIRAQLAVFEKQLDAQRQQLATLQREKERVQNLLKADAATAKQLDDLDAQIAQAQRQTAVVLEQQSASEAALSVQKTGLLAEILPLQKQIEQVEDQIRRCRIVNPIDGVVLNTYAEAGELAAYGKPLYKIAKLNPIILRAYIGGDQLATLALGQKVQVGIDAPEGSLRYLSGQVAWIADKAEFTPKIIQTKDERVQLVYAVKIRVPNDGSLKIGMPAEVKFMPGLPQNSRN